MGGGREAWFDEGVGVAGSAGPEEPTGPRRQPCPDCGVVVGPNTMTCPACGATLRKIPGQALREPPQRVKTEASWGTAELHPVLLGVSVAGFVVAIVAGLRDVALLSVIPCGATALYLHLRKGRHGGSAKGAYGYHTYGRVSAEAILKDPVLRPRQRFVAVNSRAAAALYCGIVACLLIPGAGWAIWSKTDAGLVSTVGSWVGVVAAWWRAGQRDADVDTPAFRPVE